jgi:hypothetical protein
MADVEVIATYELCNISRIKLENLLHRVLERAQLEIEVRDRFGNLVRPREWFLVPLFVVNEVIERIRESTHIPILAVIAVTLTGTYPEDWEWRELWIYVKFDS